MTIGLPNYSPYETKLKSLPSALIGGDIVAILIRQKMLTKAKEKAKNKLAPESSASINNPSTFIAGIPVTVIQQEAYSYSSEVTRYPVESGAIISDHIILDPIRIDISFETSNMTKEDAKNTLEMIEVARLLRQPVDLLTTFKKISNMVISNFSGNNSIPEWGVLKGRLSFVQIGVGIIQLKPYTGEKLIPQKQTGGPDASKSAVTPSTPGVVKPKSSTLSNLFGIKK